jgi:putative transposase/transposase-like zinc-binding protein
VAASSGRRPELADILAAHSPPLEGLRRDRRRAIRDIVLCRTAMLGGHVQVCDACGATMPIYHSCRNRHCPKCQSLDQARWVAAQAVDLLPVPYFHLVFTVPPALHPLFFASDRGGYKALFAAAMETVIEVARSRLGATPGAIAVLHTWTQTLRFHPHVHCIVTGGGLSLDRGRWISTRPNFFLPVRVLSRVFRGKLLARFEAAVTSRSLSTPEPYARNRLRQAASTPWVVYSKAPMAGPAQVLSYLSRYSHRVAIGNERIVAFHDGNVTFRYRDRRRGNRSSLLTLPANEFVQRFLRHTLPSRFVRIRHYGLLANGQRTSLLARARALLRQPAPPDPIVSTTEGWQALYQRLTGRDPELCAFCHAGRVHLVYVLEPVAAASPRGP